MTKTEKLSTWEVEQVNRNKTVLKRNGKAEIVLAWDALAKGPASFEDADPVQAYAAAFADWCRNAVGLTAAETRALAKYVADGISARK